MAVNVERIKVIADLLLGAAYADMRLAGKEDKAIRSMLAKLLEDDLSDEIEQHIRAFRLEKFDLKKSAADFAKDPPIKKRELLELVAGVRDADDEIDFDEDRYMHELAEAIELDKKDYADLALEVLEVSELKDKFEDLVGLDKG